MVCWLFNNSLSIVNTYIVTVSVLLTFNRVCYVCPAILMFLHAILTSYMLEYSCSFISIYSNNLLTTCSAALVANDIIDARLRPHVPQIPADTEKYSPPVKLTSRCGPQTTSVSHIVYWLTKYIPDKVVLYYYTDHVIWVYRHSLSM